MRELRTLDTAPDVMPEPEEPQTWTNGQSVADRAYAAVGSKRAPARTQADIDSAAEKLRAAIASAGTREELQGIWREAADLGDDWCAVIRAEAETKVSMLGVAA
ncbi:hypothetical protein OHB12_23690 [Nocardia sp. NBC_01730]|uniref:hypothetical protein n=1 Tax=Nocardia sp. NBC_01730 TaxID=2975998 RepID=UPI002E152625|nr:hypothetical protein OHB12_23690 [Nocardia sp. NBC_01730]